MPHRFVFAFALAAVAIVAASEGHSGPRDDLRTRLEQDIAQFCRDVHDAEPLILPHFIEEQPGTGSGHPDLTFEYKNIRCEGVEKPALKQCGYCGLTTQGMVCKVTTFTWQNGQYVEASSRVEPVIQ